MSKKTTSESRRRFLKAVPVAVAGAVATKTFAQGQQNAGPVNADIIRAAEVIDGVKFTSEEEAAAVGAVNGNLNQFNRLRQMAIAQDVEPAYVFKPSLPGKEPKGPATPGAPVKYTKQPLTLKRPTNLEDVAFWSVTKLAALLERKLVTSTELTNMYLGRLKRYQPSLNFYVTLMEDAALKQAAAVDAEIKAGKYRGPLHGIPWGAKDLFATKGTRTTWGGELYENQMIDYDATIVERLRDAGAVLVAKLTLGALAQGDRWFGGQTKNPWDTTRGSSGSSAGPGSATSAGCVGFGIGTETQGSILSPSAENGVVGLRPTYGRVSRYGAMALSTTMDKIGPMCRSVEDVVVVFNTIYGPDKHDGSVADAAFHWTPDTPLAGYKIAYFKTAFDNAGGGFGGGGGGGRGGGGRGGATLTPEQIAEQQKQQDDLKKTYANVLDVYTKLGAKLEAIEAPTELNTMANAMALILNVESAASFDDATRSGDINQLSTGTSRSTWPATFRQGRFVPAVEYIKAMRARTVLMQKMDEFMKYDAILSPGDSMSAVCNRTGHPAISLKAGVVGGRPRPLVITGRLYDEATICRIALAFEQATEWKDRHPTLTS